MRVFVGVELEDAVAAAAADLGRALKAQLATVAPGFTARWVSPGNLHITLWFIGEVAEPRALELAERLREPFDMAPFQLGLRGCGAFPSSGAPRVLWIATTEGTDAMRTLYHRLEGRLVPLGFEAERRPYSPHLTIARVKEPGRGSARAIRDALARPGFDTGCGVSAVASVTLFRSRLSPHGAVYEPLLRVPLMI
jgi:RNA 2',3'-cyclic 3'-phosphodiesterase